MTRERAFEAAPFRTLTREQRAFQRGASRPDAANPFPQYERVLRAAWQRGARYGKNQRAKLRPLDTARRIA